MKKYNLREIREKLQQYFKTHVWIEQYYNEDEDEYEYDVFIKESSKSKFICNFNEDQFKNFLYEWGIKSEDYLLGCDAIW